MPAPPCGHPPYPPCPPTPAKDDAIQNALNVLAWYRTLTHEDKAFVDNGWQRPGHHNGDNGPHAQETN